MTMRLGILNAWYPLAWSGDLRHAPIRRRVLGQDLVVFRGEDGGVGALRDLCPHRMAPLSLGRTHGQAVECAYHGLRFAYDGRCVHAPGQDRISQDLRVDSFPLVERHGLLWVWLGDKRRSADQSTIVDIAQGGQAGWETLQGDALLYNCHYLNLVENLCDPSHVSYLHPTTLGDQYGQGATVNTEGADRSVTVSRWIYGVPPVASLRPFIDVDVVDRWQYYDFSAPSTTVVDFGTSKAGTIGPQGDRNEGTRVLIAHCITPVDDHHCIDHWFSVRNFGIGDASVGEALHAGFRVAYEEDRAMLEAIDLEEQKHPAFKRVLIKSDAAPVRMHRIINTMISLEGQPS